MFSSILVPLDGSAAGDFALPWARELAKRSSGSLKLVRVFFPPTPPTAEGFAYIEPTLHDSARKAELAELDAAVNRLNAEEAGISVDRELLDADGTAAATLHAFAQANGVDLTVMTTQGRSPFARMIIGSVADEYLRTSPGPTLLLRADPDNPLTDAPPVVERIVIGLDGSLLAEKAIPAAEALARVFDAEIVLVLVLDAVENLKGLVERMEGAIATTMEPGSAIGPAKAYLDRMAESIRSRKRHARTVLVEHGGAAEGVLAQATSPNSVVALATHGHGGLSRLIFGSVADQIVRNATGPVLIVRPPVEE